MVTRNYVPDSGDLIWLNFDPHAGREQGGHRPALVLSPAAYNGKTGLAVACPITSRPKEYPFEVRIAAASINGAILSDHIKSLDWRTRGARKAGKAPSSVLQEVRERLAALLGFE